MNEIIADAEELIRVLCGDCQQPCTNIDACISIAKLRETIKRHKTGSTQVKA